jgi:hypothetical protein
MSMTPAPRAGGLFVRRCQSAWLTACRHAHVQRLGHAAVHTAQAAGMVASDGLQWRMSMQRHSAYANGIRRCCQKQQTAGCASRSCASRSTSRSCQRICDHRAGLCRHCYGAHCHWDASVKAGAREGQRRQGGIRRRRRQRGNTRQQQGQPHQPWWDGQRSLMQSEHARSRPP